MKKMRPFTFSDGRRRGRSAVSRFAACHLLMIVINSSSLSPPSSSRLPPSPLLGSLSLEIARKAPGITSRFPIGRSADWQLETHPVNLLETSRNFSQLLQGSRSFATRTSAARHCRPNERKQSGTLSLRKNRKKHKTMPNNFVADYHHRWARSALLIINKHRVVKEGGNINRLLARCESSAWVCHNQCIDKLNRLFASIVHSWSILTISRRRLHYKSDS